MKKIKKSASKHWIEIFKSPIGYSLMIHIDKDGLEMETVSITKFQAEQISESLGLHIRELPQPFFNAQ